MFERIKEILEANPDIDNEFIERVSYYSDDADIMNNFLDYLERYSASNAATISKAFSSIFIAAHDKMLMEKISTITDTELKELLENVDDTYPDFVCGCAAICQKHPELRDSIVEYIRNNPSATTSEIIRCINDLEGIPRHI